MYPRWMNMVRDMPEKPFEEQRPSTLKVGEILVIGSHIPNLLLYAKIRKIEEKRGEHLTTYIVQTSTGASFDTYLYYEYESGKITMAKVLIKNDRLREHEEKLARLAEEAKTSVAAHIAMLIEEGSYWQTDKIVVSTLEEDRWKVVRVDYYEHTTQKLTLRLDLYHPDLAEVLKIKDKQRWIGETRYFIQKMPFGEDVHIEVYTPWELQDTIR